MAIFQGLGTTYVDLEDSFKISQFRNSINATEELAVNYEGLIAGQMMCITDVICSEVDDQWGDGFNDNPEVIIALTFLAH